MVTFSDRSGSSKVAVMKDFTIAEPGADVAAFTDFAGLKRLCSIGRSAAYTHYQNGDFRSVVLRRPGCIKGKRLIFVPSVREFLASQSDEIDPRLSAICKSANARMQEKRAEREK